MTVTDSVFTEINAETVKADLQGNQAATEVCQRDPALWRVELITLLAKLDDQLNDELREQEVSARRPEYDHARWQRSVRSLRSKIPPRIAHVKLLIHQQAQREQSRSGRASLIDQIRAVLDAWREDDQPDDEASIDAMNAIDDLFEAWDAHQIGDGGE